MKDVKWEAERVAAAFGVENWAEDVWFMYSTASLFSGKKGELEVVWRVSPEGEVIHLRVGNGGVHDCMLTWRKTAWWANTHRFHQEYNELMARGLFCLGIDEEDVLAKLNAPLSAHEQMELRLSMPREFWPQPWLGEADVVGL